MQLYQIGKIVSIGKTYIILETNLTGYIVYVANAEEWQILKGEQAKVYLFHFQNEYVNALYGFGTFSSKILFEDLINITGVGPKTALAILKQGEATIAKAIANGDVKVLMQTPHLGQKSSNQIIFELQKKYEKFVSRDRGTPAVLPSEIKLSLKNLGFTSKQIDYALANLEPETSVELLIEKAIKVIANAKFA